MFLYVLMPLVFPDNANIQYITFLPGSKSNLICLVLKAWCISSNVLLLVSFGSQMKLVSPSVTYIANIWTSYQLARCFLFVCFFQ